MTDLREHPAFQKVMEAIYKGTHVDTYCHECKTGQHVEIQVRHDEPSIEAALLALCEQLPQPVESLHHIDGDEWPCPNCGTLEGPATDHSAFMCPKRKQPQPPRDPSVDARKAVVHAVELEWVAHSSKDAKADGWPRFQTALDAYAAAVEAEVRTRIAQERT